MNTYFKLSIFSILLAFSSCTEDDTILDTTKPEVILATPTEHQAYEFGQAINIQAILKDNIELGAYKIEIHSDEDGHQHRSMTSAWEFTDTAVIEGTKEYLLNKTIPIPAGDYTEGHYHLGIIVIDKAGNETQSFIEIVIGEDDHH